MPKASDLTEDEKKELNQVVGKLAWPPLAMGVVRLYFCKCDDGVGTDWVYSGCFGALLLIVDRAHEKKPRRIQLWSLQSKVLQFQQELYAEMKYDTISPYFHSFEISVPNGTAPGVSVLAGLCFCSELDASAFAGKIFGNIPTDPRKVAFAKEPEKGFFSKLAGSAMSMFGLSEEENRFKISAPTNFQHTQHIGYDPDNGFDVKNLSEEMISIFKAAGVKKKDLTNPEVAKIIYQQVQDSMGAHDSIGNVLSAIPTGNNFTASRESMGTLTRPVSLSTHGARQPAGSITRAPPVPSFRVPPRPPQASLPSSVPTGSLIGSAHVAAPVFAPSVLVGPPVGIASGPPVGIASGPPVGITAGPPVGITAGPPVGITSGPPVSVPVGPPSTIQITAFANHDSDESSPVQPSGSRSNLLAAIQKGTTLRKVADASAAKSPNSTFNSIQKGAILPRTVPEPTESKIAPIQATDLVSRLTAAMASRNKALAQEDDDGDDWND